MGTDRPAAGAEDARGRQSETQTDIPPAGWRDVLLRTKDAIGKDYVGLVAAGMAFYAVLALFPGVTALVSIYGLFADPQTVQNQLALLADVMPPEAFELLDDRVGALTQNGKQTLSVAALVGVLLSVWGSTKGVRAFIGAMNIAYGEDERRSLIRLNLLAIALTACLLVLAGVALVTVVMIPVLLELLPLTSTQNWLVAVLRWPVIAVFFVATLAMLYRYAPAREHARWSWLPLGSVLAVALWLVASIAFSVFLRNFGNYDQVYGSLGAVVALLMWFWLSSYAIVLGAELNAESERQTRRDSTTGRPQPMGERGAYVADTLGRQP